MESCTLNVMSVSVMIPSVWNKYLLLLPWGAGSTRTTLHVTCLGSYCEALTRAAHSFACFSLPNDSTVSLKIFKVMLSLGIFTTVVAGGGGGVAAEGGRVGLISKNSQWRPDVFSPHNLRDDESHDLLFARVGPSKVYGFGPSHESRFCTYQHIIVIA